MKKVLLAVSILSSTSVLASPVLEACYFEQDHGREFTFLESTPLMSFESRMNKPAYPHFVSDRFHGESVPVEKYEYRNAKLDTSSFYRRQETLKGGSVENIRYYRVLVDNCDTVWLKISESDVSVARYMDSENHFVSGRVPWDRVDESLSIRFSDTLKNLNDAVGQYLTVMPFRDNSVFRGKSVDSQQWVEVEDFAKLTIKKVIPTDFVYEGKRLGSIQLMVATPDSKEFFIPWDPERLFIGNPFNSKDIKPTHYGTIKRSAIKTGMSVDEVILSWGEPEKLRLLPVYEGNSGKGRFIKDDEHPYGDKFNSYKSAAEITGKITGKYYELYYPDRQEGDKPLAFNEKGILIK